MLLFVPRLKFQLIFSDNNMSQPLPQKRVPGKKFETADVFSLFYFPSDNTWDNISLTHSSWGSFPRSDRAFVSLGEVISLRVKNKPCSGVLCAKADTLEELASKKEKLLSKMDDGTFDPSNSFLRDLNKSSDGSNASARANENVEVGSAHVPERTPTNLLPETDNHSDSESSSNDTDGEAVVETPIENVDPDPSSSFVTLQKETLTVLKRLNTSLERRRREDRRMRILLGKFLNNLPGSNSSASPVQVERVLADNELVCPNTGESLMDLPGSSASKFACNIARKLFGEEELINGMLDPQRDSPRVQLERAKIELIKSCVLKRFPNDDWNAVREAVNQLGRDMKRKRKMRPSPLVEQDNNKKASPAHDA